MVEAGDASTPGSGRSEGPPWACPSSTCSEHGGWRAPRADAGDYDEEAGETIYDRLALLPPWGEFDRWGNKIGEYLPTSPQTGEPCTLDRAWEEWRWSRASGACWDVDAEAAARAASTNLRGQADVSLAHRRVLLVPRQTEAVHLEAWMRVHALEMGPRTLAVYAAFYRNGRRVHEIAAELGIGPSSVLAALARIRAAAGLPALVLGTGGGEAPTPGAPKRRTTSPRPTALDRSAGRRASTSAGRAAAARAGVPEP